ncbi:MAG TPA: hypothetical protein VLJ79_20060 [Candidatus Binatia bacterium]|nr:hypothetical protein [Candidatus Binatia bacterium]
MIIGPEQRIDLGKGAVSEFLQMAVTSHELELADFPRLVLLHDQPG